MTRDQAMRVVIKHPGEPAAVTTIASGLTPLQEIVGGYIEAALRVGGLVDGDLVLYCNEEGRLRALPSNIARPTDRTLIVGSIVAVKCDADGEAVSMTEAEAAAACKFITSMGV